jgi:carboxymethylenebutenolidase
MQQREDSVSTAEGSFGLTVWSPPGGSGPGLVLVQEIYGVSDYIRAVGQDLAELGYVVAAPDLFWRLAPGYQAKHDEQGLHESLAMGSRFDLATGVADTVLALRQLAEMPETGGTAGLIGFCLGGSIAYLAAAEASPAVLVSFYGSAVPDRLDALNRIRCPLQFHFGGSDPYIPREQVARVEDAVAGRPDTEIHVEPDAGHAFHNRMAPMFYQPEPAARAWRRTEEFLREYLPAQVP